MGVYIERGIGAARTDRVFAGILIVILLSYGLFKAVDLLGRAVTPWMRRTP
jgi:ABC-type nitrate/sulfonate/bicarbonate transport system permease component